MSKRRKKIDEPGKRGPKELPPGRARRKFMQVRVNDEEYALLSEGAQLAEQTFSDWARRELIKIARQLKRPAGGRKKRGAAGNDSG